MSHDRCAVHYSSQKTRDEDRFLFSKLQHATIYISNGISKVISVVQYGETVTVENSRAKFHLDDDNDELRLYVPRDEIAREECFFRQLPRRLMAYLGIFDPSAEAVLNGIIGCQSLIAVDGILKDAGIVEVNGIERPSELDQETQQYDYRNISLEQDTLVRTESPTSQSSRSTSVSSTKTNSTTSNETEHPADVPSRYSTFGARSAAQSSRPVSTLAESVSIMDNALRGPVYASLLDRVIESAGLMTIPAFGGQSIDYRRGHFTFGIALPGPIFTVRSMERDRKVGAAGELLVSHDATFCSGITDSLPYRYLKFSLA